MVRILMIVLLGCLGCGPDFGRSATAKDPVSGSDSSVDASMANLDGGVVSADAAEDAAMVPDALLADATSAPLPACAQRQSLRPDGQLRIEGCRLVREGGGTVIPKGIVVAQDSLTRASRTPLHEQAHYDDLAQGGYDLVWLLVTWAGIEPQEGVYDAAYMGRICQQADFAQNSGVDVILVMYQERLGQTFGGHGFPSWYLAGDDGNESLEPDEPELTATWDRLWRSEASGLVGAWSQILETCEGVDGLQGVVPLTNPVAATDRLPTVELYNERVLGLFRDRFGPSLGFFEPVLTEDGVVWPAGGLEDVGVFTGAWGPARGPSNSVVELEDWVAEVGGSRGLHGGTVVVRVPAEAESHGLSRIEGLAFGMALWNDGFGGASPLRDAEGVPTARFEALAERPWPRVVSGVPRTFGFEADGWSLSWETDLSNEGLTRVFVGAEGAAYEPTLRPDGLTWFSNFDPVTRELQIFVQEEGVDAQLLLMRVQPENTP